MESIEPRQRMWLAGYLLARAVAVTALGLLLVLRPNDTVRTVARISGGLLLVIGAVDLVAPLLRGSAHAFRLPLVLRGVVTIGLGAVILLVTEATVTVLSIMLGMQLVVGGGVSVMVGVRFRHRVPGWRGIAIRGGLAVGTGALAIGWPGITVPILAGVLGVQWLISGAISTFVAVRVAAPPAAG